MSNQSLSSFVDYKNLVVDTKLKFDDAYKLKTRDQLFLQNKEARVLFEIKTNKSGQKLEKVIIRPLLGKELIFGTGLYETCPETTLEVLLFMGTLINVKLGNKNYNLDEIQKLYSDSDEIMQIYDLVSDEAAWYFE